MIIYTFILILDSYLDRIRSYLIIFNGLQVNYSVKARLAQNTIHGGRRVAPQCITREEQVMTRKDKTIQDTSQQDTTREDKSQTRQDKRDKTERERDRKREREEKSK